MQSIFTSKLGVVVSFISAVALLASSGGRNNNWANAPGDSGYCANCHSGGPAGGSIYLSGLPSSYVPGETYNFTMHLEHPSQAGGGFQLVATDGATNAMQGSFTATTGTKINNTLRLVQNAPQTFSGGATSWPVTWTAPSSGAPANIKFYYAGNAANLTGNTSGDYGLFGASDEIPMDMPACNPPINFTTPIIKDTRVRLAWTAAPNATRFQIRTREQGTSAWTTKSSTAPNKFLSGLDAGTTYEFRVRSVCGTAFSDWSPIGTFTTSDCTIPATSSVDNIRDVSARVNYSSVPGAISYRVRYRPISGGAWSSVGTTNTFININGLMPGTTYEYRMRTVCDWGPTVYGPSSTFSTDACTAPSDILISNVTSNSADISYTASTGASSTKVLYRVGSSGAFTTKTASSSPYTLTGLMPGTMYEVKLRSTCGYGASSESATFMFTTPSVQSNNSGVSVVQRTENEAVSTISDFTVFPNPASNELRILLNEESKTEHWKIVVTDAFGREVLRIPSVSLSEELPAALDISLLEKGVYILNLSSKEKAMSKKFIKQ